MLKKKKKNNDVVEIDFQKYHKFDVSDDDIQSEFTIDESIFEDAENIEEVEVDENENNETEQ